MNVTTHYVSCILLCIIDSQHFACCVPPVSSINEIVERGEGWYWNKQKQMITIRVDLHRVWIRVAESFGSHTRWLVGCPNFPCACTPRKVPEEIVKKLKMLQLFVRYRPATFLSVSCTVVNALIHLTLQFWSSVANMSVQIDLSLPLHVK
jgi:hypothetical protein